MARQTKRPPETINGAIAAIPLAVLDSPAFTGASDKAKALLFAFMRQINGRNNGHLHLAPQWLKRQGFTSSSNYKARDELLKRGLIIQTRYGGLNMGTNCFAVTWLAISNFVGLDIGAADFQRGAWALCELPPTARRPKPINKKRARLYDDRSSATTTTVAVGTPPATTTVAQNVLLASAPTTTIVNNVFNTNTPSNHPKRIVGVKGKSGIAKAGEMSA